MLAGLPAAPKPVAWRETNETVAQARRVLPISRATSPIAIVRPAGKPVKSFVFGVSHSFH